MFLRGINAPNLWRERDVTVIGELGFGAGVNFNQTVELFLHTTRPSQLLFYVAFEGHPLPKKDFDRLSPDSPAIQTVRHYYPPPWRGVYPLMVETRIRLFLYWGRIETWRETFRGLVDAWYLDGFSPRKNPAMWDTPTFTMIRRHSTKNARIASFSVAVDVRRRLERLGFQCKKRQQEGPKKETLCAVLPTGPDRKAPPPLNIAGGGIAGLMINFWWPRPSSLYDPKGLLQAASGSGTHLIGPRFLREESPRTALEMAAFFLSCSLYDDLQKRFPVWRGRNLIYAPNSPRDQIRLAKNLEEKYPGRHLMRAIRPEEARQMLGINPAFPSVLYPLGGCITSYFFRQIFRGHFYLRPLPAQKGLTLLAMGADLVKMGLPIIPKRGQLLWLDDQKLSLPLCNAVCGAGYAIPNRRGKTLVGASWSLGDNPNPDPTDDKYILQKITRTLPGFLHAYRIRNRWAAVRGTTPNNIPFLTQLKPQIFALGGLGARGFQWASLLALLFSADMHDIPLPVDPEALPLLSYPTEDFFPYSPTC